MIRRMAAVELLTYLMNEAFAGSGIEETNEGQSLLANLSAVDDALWRARLLRSVRTIESIVLHVGSCKVMYRDHAFGARQLTWESREVQPWPDGQAPMTETLDWLRQTHADLMREVAALSDDDLMKPRWANWGEERETRWLLSMLCQHDTYHAGEINHIRSIASGEDRWAWQIYEGIDPLADAPSD
jgi:uncharacterized damage-inducible protein DinB